MKHIKELVLEARKLKPYEKYKDIINWEFKQRIFNIEANKTKIYEDPDWEICIKLKTWGGLNRLNFGYCQKYFGTDYLHYIIEPANGSQMWVTLHGIPKEFFEKLDLEMKTSKFNV